MDTTAIPDDVNSDPRLHFLQGKGEMRKRIREFDWTKTELGHPANWPNSLKTAVSIMLNNSGPVYIAAGSGFVQLYNDAYAPILGELKHPQALGLTTPETWAEIWDFVGPLFRRVVTFGTAVSMENVLLPMLRNGYLEECYFSFTYSPLPDENGKPIGLFVTVTETTGEYITNRRANTIRTLVQYLSNAMKMQDIYTALERTAKECFQDLLFVLMYTIREDRKTLELVSSAGIKRGSPLSPEVLDPFCHPLYKGAVDLHAPFATNITLSKELFEWEPPHSPYVTPKLVCIKPLHYSNFREAGGYLILPVNPMRPYDQGQKEFLESIRLHLENAIRRVNTYEIERREHEHQFRSVMSVLPCLVWLSNTQKECMFVNDPWLKLTGLSFEEAIGSGWMKAVHPDDVPVVMQERNLRNRKTTSSLEFRLRDGKGNYHWLFNEITPRYGTNHEFLGYIGTCIDITERKRNEQQILASRNEMRMLYDRLKTVREEERCALAREVHDQLGQILSAAKIDIKLLEEEFKMEQGALSRQEVWAELASASRTIEQAIHVVRHLATELRPPELESQGLAAAVDWHLRDFERRTRIDCKLEVEEDLPELNDTVAITLFRILQESLTNILRHAKASQVRIMLQSRDNQVRLRVLDNGIGISRSGIGSFQSMGVKGMRERALLAGGRLVIGRIGGEGTLVSAKIPLNDNQDPRLAQQADFKQGEML